MKASIDIENKKYRFDTALPLDISIPLRAGKKNVNAWYVDAVKIEPVMTEQFVGSVAKGGVVNFNNISFNPHGNGTHTECVGHISLENFSINQCLKEFFFPAKLISIEPEKSGEDLVIRSEQIKKAWDSIDGSAKAIIIRTLPNSTEKINRQYSSSNPPYLEKAAIDFILSQGLDHLLIDLPSVDKEFDDGVLAAHHAFWDYPTDPQDHRTITELIYIKDEIEDGYYLLNLQIASFENDASPSKPVLYRLEPEA